MSTPAPTNISAGQDGLQVVLSILSFLLLAVQVYLVYRVDRAHLRIEQYTGISEKCEVDVKPKIQGRTTELLTVTNTSLLPIKELQLKINLTVERRNEADLSFKVHWQRKSQA
jgi:hypothetical protein